MEINMECNISLYNHLQEAVHCKISTYAGEQNTENMEYIHASTGISTHSPSE
jgi:hypothetical protein